MLPDDPARKSSRIAARVILSFAVAVMLLSSTVIGINMYANAQNSTSANNSNSTSGSSNSNSTSSESEEQASQNATTSESESQQSGNATSADSSTNSTSTSSDSGSQASGNSTESSTSEQQPNNSTDNSSESSASAEEESGQSPQKAEAASGEALTQSDTNLSRTVSFATMLFEGDVAEEVELTITWNTDGSTKVEDSRGYSYDMNVVPEGASFSLLQNSTMVVQRVEGKDIQYDVYWEPVENSEGTQDRFKFTIVGSSTNGSEIAFKVDSEDRIESMRDGKTDGPEKDHDTFLVTKAGLTQEESQREESAQNESIAIDDEEPDAEGIGLDWSDAIDSGYEMRFDSSRSELSVKVGKEFSIDPTTVTTTSSNLSPGTNTYYENEKRVVRVGSVLFAFYIGSGPNIAYRYSADDGNTWSSSGVSVGTGSIGADTPRWTVAATEYDGSPRVVVFYHTISGSTMFFKARQGTVDGTSISWTNSSPFPLFNVTGTNGAESAGVDTEGNIYVGFRWEPSSGPWTYSTMKSTDGGASFSSSLNAMNHNSNYRTPMALTKLEDGKMLYVFAKQDHSELFYQVYNGSAWSSITNTTGAGVSTGVFKHISATSNGTNSAYVAFVSGGNSGNLKIAKWNSTGGFIGFETADTSLSHSLPSIAITSNSTGSKLRIYSIASSKVYETIKDASWQTPTNPFGTSFTSLDQLSSPFNDVGAIWRENSGSPYNVRFARDTPTIIWSPSTIDVQASIFAPIQLNLTSDIAITDTTVNSSASIRDLVIFQTNTSLKIPEGQLQSLWIALIIPPNTSSGWHNGTINISAHGATLSESINLNISVPTVYEESVELEEGNLTRIAIASLSPFFNDTYDVSLYFTSVNGTGALIKTFYDVYTVNGTEEEGLGGSSTALPIGLDECTQYAFKHDQSYAFRTEEEVGDDLAVAANALHNNTMNPLIIRTGINWNEVDKGKWNETTGEWIPKYEDDAIIRLFDNLIIQDSKAYVVLGVGAVPTNITDGRITFSLKEIIFGAPDIEQVYAQYLYREEANGFINYTINKIKEIGAIDKVALWQIDNEPTQNPARDLIVVGGGISPIVTKPIVDWRTTSEALSLWLNTTRTEDPDTPRVVNVFQAAPYWIVPEGLQAGEIIFTVEPFRNLLGEDPEDPLAQELAQNIDIMGFDIYPDQWMRTSLIDNVPMAFDDALEQAEIQYTKANAFGFTGRWALPEFPAGPKRPLNDDPAWSWLDLLPFSPKLYLLSNITSSDVSDMLENVNNTSYFDGPPALVSFFQLRSPNSGPLSYAYPFHHAYGLINEASGEANTDFEDVISAAIEQDCSEYLGMDIKLIDDYVYTVWSEGTSFEDARIQFRMSTDGGTSFGETMTLSMTETAIRPHLAVAGDNVYVVWEDFEEGEVYFARSTINGLDFDPPENLSDDESFSYNAQILASEDDVYIMWEGEELMFIKSADGGDNFNEAINLDENSDDTIDPQMTIQGDNLYFVWIGDNGTSYEDPYFRRSTDNGNTLDGIINLGLSSDPTFAMWPSIAASGDYAYVAWNEVPSSEEADEIYLSISDNNGTSFGNQMNMSSSTDILSLHAQVSASDNNVQLTWWENGIKYTNSTNSGTTWSDIITLTEVSSSMPIIATGGEKYYVGWVDSVEEWEGYGDVHFRVSDDNGVTLSDMIDIPSTQYGNSIAPVIATNEDDLFVVFADSFGNRYSAVLELHLAVSNE